jgi:hypothetical protein
MRGWNRELGPVFDLTASNYPLPSPPFAANTTVNYDRTVRLCPDIGEFTTSTRGSDNTTLLGQQSEVLDIATNLASRRHPIASPTCSFRISAPVPGELPRTHLSDGP